MGVEVGEAMGPSAGRALGGTVHQRALVGALVGATDATTATGSPKESSEIPSLFVSPQTSEMLSLLFPPQLGTQRGMELCSSAIAHLSHPTEKRALYTSTPLMKTLASVSRVPIKVFGCSLPGMQISSPCWASK